jgi:hypothetical protein
MQLFDVACYFYSGGLQELVVAQEIIPNLTASTALTYLQELNVTNT